MNKLPDTHSFDALRSMADALLALLISRLTASSGVEEHEMLVEHAGRVRRLVDAVDVTDTEAMAELATVLLGEYDRLAGHAHSLHRVSSNTPSGHLTAEDFPVTQEEQQATLDATIDSLGRIPENAANRDSHAPTLTYIVGQPAAGKTTLISLLNRDNPGVVIDSDLIRLTHPRLGDIMEADPLRMDVLSNQPVGFLVQGLFDHCFQQGLNIYIENTLTNAKVVAKTIAAARTSGFTVNFEVLAVHPAVSQLGIAGRYLAQLRYRVPFPRWTSIPAHDIAYAAIPQALTTVIGEYFTAEDRARVWDSGLSVVWDSEDHGDDAAIATQLVAAVTAIREAPIADAHRDRFDALRPQLAELTQTIPATAPIVDAVTGLFSE